MNIDILIVGLGNPGSRYAFTRHNVGFMALDLIAGQNNVRFSDKGIASKCQFHGAEIEIKGKKCLLIKPQTFMNLSGESLAKLFQQHTHLREKPLIVFHDEADLPFGRLRVKLGGGDAGNNGLKSLRESLGNGDSYRIRMGVGKPLSGSSIALADYVLTPFSKAEEAALTDMLIRSTLALEPLIEGNLQKSQQIAAMDSSQESD